MLNRITRKIQRTLASFLLPPQTTELERISSMPNVFLDQDHSLSPDAAFFISPAAKAFRAGKYAGCRRFCSFLVFEGGSLEIGPGVYFNSYCSINCLGTIEIGEGTLLGEGVKLYDHNHRYDYRNGQLHFEKASFAIGKISVGKNCWIGSNVTILNNVTIGDNVIVGANCLIYKSIPANSIVKHGEQLIVSREPGSEPQP